MTWQHRSRRNQFRRGNGTPALPPALDSPYQAESRGQPQKTTGSNACWIQKHRFVRKQIANRLAAEMADLPVMGDKIEHAQEELPAQGGKVGRRDEGHGAALFHFRCEIPIAGSLRYRE